MNNKRKEKESQAWGDQSTRVARNSQGEEDDDDDDDDDAHEEEDEWRRTKCMAKGLFTNLGWLVSLLQVVVN